MRKPKILLVDNDPLELKIKQAQFCHAGYYLDVVSSASEARRKLMLADYDYLITDLMMPLESGLDLKEFVKYKYPEIPVYTASCHMESDLPKPYKPADFENLVLHNTYKMVV